MADYEKIITHNLESASGATGVITQFWSDGYKVIPKKLEINTGDQLTATFTKDVSGSTNITAVVRKSDYTYTQTTEESTWDITHNLNSDALICQTFSQSEEIIPDNITHDFNESAITFSEAITGSAEFIWVQTKFSVSSSTTDPLGLSLSVSGSYWKAGTGNTETFNSQEANDIETMATSGGFISYTESTVDEDIAILEFDITGQQDINITEIGIFNDESRIMFYTKCSPIFKPSESTLKMFYKIRKFNT